MQRRGSASVFLFFFCLLIFNRGEVAAFSHHARPSPWCLPAAVAADEVEKGDGLDPIWSLSQVTGMLGGQWGDEGKGKLVDILTEHFDVVARCQVEYETLPGWKCDIKIWRPSFGCSAICAED